MLKPAPWEEAAEICRNPVQLDLGDGTPKLMDDGHTNIHHAVSIPIPCAELPVQ